MGKVLSEYDISFIKPIERADANTVQYNYIEL